MVTHPSTEAILKFFGYNHLPPHLQEVSKRFSDLALWVGANLQGAEATVALRKLPEAKDAAVRAAISP